MPKAVLYARYSPDNQSVVSIEDQFRTCRDHAGREHWQVVDTYHDPAISGASVILRGCGLRPRRSLSLFTEAFLEKRAPAIPAALVLVEQIVAEHVPILFRESAGCCDGSSPMYYTQNELIVGDPDVLLRQSQ